MIGDLLFNLMGQPDPRRELAAALAGQSMPANGTMNLTGATAGGPGTGMASPNQPPSASQSPPPASPPQPDAYTSPPDLVNLYMKLSDRQQGNESINRGMGMLLAGFAQPQDRAGMVGAMSGITPDAGVDMNNVVHLYDNMYKMQLQRQTMANAGKIAAQLKMPIEQVLAAIQSGGLDNIIQQNNLQNMPLNQAQTQEALAKTSLDTAQINELRRKTEMQKSLANNSAALAAQYGMPESVVQSLIASGGWDNMVTEMQKEKAKESLGTNEHRNYLAAKADAESRDPTQPFMSELDFMRMGGGTGGGTKLGLQPQYRVKRDDKGEVVKDAQGNPEVEALQLADRPGATPQVVPGLKPKAEKIESGTETRWVIPQTGEVIFSQPKGEAAQIEEKAVATDRAEMKTVFPDALAAYKKTKSIIADVRNDPNLSNLLGIVGGRVPTMFRGQAMTDLQHKLDQLASTPYIDAFKDLRGAGRVTQQEAGKSFEARSRLQDQTQSPKVFNEAIDQIENDADAKMAKAYIIAGEELPPELKKFANELPADVVNRFRSGGSVAPSPAPNSEKKKRVYDPNTGDFK